MKPTKNRYAIRLRTLSPLHIGSGTDFMPGSYIIDGKMLYEFDTVDFYHELSPQLQRAFSMKATTAYTLKNFLDEHKETVKKVSMRSLHVTSEIARTYEKQYNKDGTPNKNRLQIAKTATTESIKIPYVPGSSFKGVIDTALEIFTPKAGNEVRQNLLVSDLVSIDAKSFCGIAYRRHKTGEREGKGIPLMVEALEPESVFAGVIESDRRGESEKIFSWKEIAQSLENFARQADEKSFLSYKKIAPKGSIVFRMGRFSGQEFTAIGLTKKPVTHSLMKMNNGTLLPFGWVALEYIEGKELETLMETYKEYVEQKTKKIVERRSSLVDERKRREQEEEERKRKLETERQEEEKKKAAEVARLASLSPVDRLLEEHDIPTLIRMMQNSEIEDYEKIKIELAQKIKKELKKTPKTWEKAKQKALKRKEFIQKILGEY
ncbi:type III-A CRISPR-associated RAMP protein Csm5 [Hydrogenimonas cancrithermarum]|uniref:CRISPR system Cms protein Csm5 n=1 Tax=Hydrogenimonas cancrithermarum TaxID=2993563 RepID=A0ABN6WSB4_9BACT|nr:type III-A CRISPR-associated RAMP protein Csm5 [Hydrogenimonas cancrithermarum]BDY11961.1 hypothetical protein HCR_02730 [Hydrogenimonas cancrithermarum]